MNDRERFEKYEKIGVQRFQTKLGRVKSICEQLLHCLYKPDNDLMFVADLHKIAESGISLSEPINWGGLNISVVRIRDKFIITLDEASPEECPTLCAYFEDHLTSWGWDVEVKTEW
jgi:hypothetical protein